MYKCPVCGEHGVRHFPNGSAECLECGRSWSPRGFEAAWERREESGE